MLNIYKASAGAGKTFALTLEYFKIIFSNPYEYKNILAVTFTNKATEEMKSRILNELHLLAIGAKSSYSDLLKQYIKLSDKELQERAQLLQSLLLHDYGRFAITTIDKFFQRIIKSFTRELGIFAGYNVELNTEAVLSKSIGKVMERVRKDNTLRTWIMELIARNIEEGNSWRVNDKILSLGSELFKESYKQLDEETLHKLSDKQLLKEYSAFINGELESYETTLTEFAQRAISLIEANALSIEDFSNGRTGALAYFVKILAGDFAAPGKRPISAADSDKGWYTAKSPNKSNIEAIMPQLQRLLSQAIDYFNQHDARYRAAGLVKKDIYLLGVLNDLYAEVRSYCDENGLLLLSDSAQILNKLMAGNDTSFIFEKIGNQFKHIMIDEFQDTSTMQWNNFKPLLENSVAQDATTMLVGDVKQSIYRWRNSDWMLLARDVEEQFKHLGTKNIVLNNNWRSSFEVVSFNNLFFMLCAHRLSELYSGDCVDASVLQTAIKEVYGDVKQEPKRNESGYVEIEFVGDERGRSGETEILERVVETINDIRSRGGQLREITILVRKAQEGAAIADYLMNYGKGVGVEPIPFISNDSLYLWSSISIKFIICVMRYIIAPDDCVNIAMLYHYYYNFLLKDRDADLHTVFSQPKRDDDELLSILRNELLHLDTLSLYELIEHIISHLKLGNNADDVPYLIAFQDVVYNYESNNPNNISQFLEWWEIERKGQVLSTSDAIDAVRILTIHKSKGLEFNYVILPFCHWPLDPDKPIRRIWCENKEEGFNTLKSIPLNYTSKLAQTSFRDSYNEEHLKAYVDSLNLLYVAQTRAKYELYIYPYQPNSKNINVLIQDTISDIKALPQAEELGFGITDEMHLTYGTKRSAHSVVKDGNKPDENLSLTLYNVSDNANRISIRYSYQDYEEPGEKTRRAIDKGKVLHMLFKSIAYAQDIKAAVRVGVVQGIIDITEQEDYCQLMDDYIHQEGVNEWFSPKYKVINERDILFPNGERVRPDRVMLTRDGDVIVVDYKFGLKESKKYEKQVAFYCKTLRSMGYKNVSGIIWYPKLQKQVTV
ncbi:MAG: UvrD-helicase domain-containing protein [Marinifilaceae bacterium]